jgi:transcriptional regulator with XRE-family HTH domain
MPDARNLQMLRQLREARRLSLTSMAIYFGLSSANGRNTVSAWERGTAIPAAEHRRTFIRYLDEELGLGDDAELFQRVWQVLETEWGWTFPTLHERQRDAILNQDDQHRPDAPVAVSSAERRHRQVMLTRVAHLCRQSRDSLLGAMPQLELGLAEQIIEPIERTVGDSSRPRAPGTPLVHLFDKYDGALLILGPMGSGKTTSLLSLADVLLERAWHDDQSPIPIVAYLSSWKAHYPSFRAWLLEALNRLYDVPQHIGAPCIDQGNLTLLLDGFDEVARELQEGCAQAINAYRHDHGMERMVVCCRIDDYLRVTPKLRMQGAVVVQRLTEAQIGDYLHQTTANSAGLLAVLHQERGLLELARSPLMLRFIVEAYQTDPDAILTAMSQSAARQHWLIDMFIASALQRQQASDAHAGNPGHAPDMQGSGPAHANQPTYTEQEVRHYLAWLARFIQQQDGDIFRIERLQPASLPHAGQMRMVTWGTALGLALLFFLAGMGLFGLVCTIMFGVERGLLLGVVGGVIVALVGGVIGYSRSIEPLEGVYWSWSQVHTRLPTALLPASLGGLGSGAIITLVGNDTTLGLAFGVTIGLMASLAGALLNGLDGLVFSDSSTTLVPNQGIRHSIRISLRQGMLIGFLISSITGVSVALLIGLVLGQMSAMIAGVLGALAGSFFIGLVSCLRAGGRSAIQHGLLRLLLTCNRMTPWNYTQFLDYCVRAGLLQRVGGGYTFVHSLIREYVAVPPPTERNPPMQGACRADAG